MGRLALFLLLLWFALAGMVVVARGAGESAARPPALGAFEREQCLPSPCWRGVRPGRTTIRQAEAIFNEQFFRVSGNTDRQVCWSGEVCWYYVVRPWVSSAPDVSVGEIVVRPAPGDLKLGDAVRLFGSPLTAQLCWIPGSTSGDVDPGVPRPLLVAYLTFKGGIKVVAFNPNDPMLPRYVPEMIVHKIYYQAGYDIFRPPWPGFVSRVRLGCGR